MGAMWKIIDADAFYQQEWVHCGMYEPMVGVENIKGGRETLKKWGTGPIKDQYPICFILLLSLTRH
jgi:hypothetical protein